MQQIARRRVTPDVALSAPPAWSIAVALGFVAAYASLALPGATFDWLIQEDGLYETVGTLGFLAAAVFLAVNAVRTHRAIRDGRDDSSRLKPWILGGLGLGLFFAAGEEISWGQRILGIETPDELADANVQGETNLHNLEAVNGAMDVGFQLMWAGLFVGLPLLAALWPWASETLGRFLPIAPPVIAGFLILNYLLAQTSERVFDGSLYESKYPLVHSVTEIKEAVVGIVIGIAAWLILRRTPREPAAS